MVEVRTSQAPGKMSRVEFSAHFQRSYYNPLFDREHEAIARLEEIAWKAYCDSRKAPKTSKAGMGFAAVSNAIVAMRTGKLTQPDADLKPPRQK